MSERLSKEGEAAWQAFAERVGGQFHCGGLLGGTPRMIVRHKCWTILLEAIIVHYSSSEHSSASTKTCFRITTQFVGAPTDTFELCRAVASLDSSLHVDDSESWWGPYYPKNVRRLRLQLGTIPEDGDRLQKHFVVFCAALEHLVAQSLAWEDDPLDIVGRRPRGLALIKGLFGGLILGIGFGLVLGAVMALMIGSQSNEIVMLAICGSILNTILVVPGAIVTVLLFWISDGKQFGKLYGTGQHRRFAKQAAPDMRTIE